MTWSKRAPYSRGPQDDQQAQLVVGNVSQAIWTDAISQLTALADLICPPPCEPYTYCGGRRSQNRTVVVPRPSTSFTAKPGAYLRSVRVLEGRTLKIRNTDRFFYGGSGTRELNFRTRFQLFDPDDPARYQRRSSAGTENATLGDSFDLALNIENNFDESNRQVSDSVLPAVRSDVVRYLNEGEAV